MLYLNTNFDYFHCIIILMISFLSHGIILLNDGLYWDGWLMDAWQQRKDWKTMKRFYSEVGMPLLYYQHKLISYLPLRIHCYRFLAFISTFISAFAVYLIASSFGFLSNTSALLLTLLYLSYTGYHMNIDIIVGLQYTFPMAVFYSACFVALHSESQIGLAYWVLWGISLCMFLLSFNANSILVYFFGFLVFKAMIFFQGNGISLASFMNFTVSNIEYLLLPFIFWFIKERFTPRHGQYAHYNKPKFSIIKIFNGICSLCGYGFEDSITRPIRFVFKKKLLLIPLSAVIVFHIYFRAVNLKYQDLSLYQGSIIFLFGFMLLVLAGLPYILVGQPFFPYGWATKNSLLFPLPVALMQYGIMNELLPGQAIMQIVIFLIITNAVYLIYIYLLYLAVYVKNRSWLFNLSLLPEIQSISIFQICDIHYLRGDSYIPSNEHKTAYLFYMFNWVWGDSTRVGVYELIPRNLAYTRDEVVTELRNSTLDYAMTDVEVDGAQARIIVKTGNIHSPMKIALMYIQARYFAPNKMAPLLSRVTSVDVHLY
jgi:hypothetical protein